MAEQIAEIESSDDDLDEDSTIIDVIRRILHSGAASTRVSMGNAVQQVIASVWRFIVRI